MPKKPTIKTNNQLITENEDLQRRLEEAEETLNAIRSGQVDAIIVSGADGEQIFTLKQAEEALQVSEEKYRRLVDEISDGVYVTDGEGVFTFANPALARIYGVKNPQALVGRKFLDFIAPEMLETLGQAYRSTMRTGGVPGFINGLIMRPDGTRAFIEDKPSLQVKGSQIVGSQGVVRDITERKKAEEELINTNKELAFQNGEKEKRAAELSIVVENLKHNEDLLRETGTLAKMGGSEIDLSNMAMNWTDEVFRIHELEPGRMPSVEEAIDYYAPEARPIFREAIKNAIATGEGWDLELPFFTAKGKHLWIRSMGKPEMKDGKTSRILCVFQDITERKQAEARIQLQLEHLTALSSIDRVIASNFDLNLSLTEILTHVTKELGIDAADILILNPGLQMLEFGAGDGFRTNAIRKRQVRLGESHAGRAALERQLVQIPNLKEEPDNSFINTFLTGADFVCYYGMPLIAKGQVKGVMEVFHRLALEPNSEWFDFLNTLAGQAAIAIENSTLFESLQRSNSELTLAYDATIEGWSHALDLRDRETEGHTQRVTEMTVKLARLLGLSEMDLVQVRWGALLHDIGKMGVPDGILLKPGPLTDEEWLVMKKHPSFAYEMLSPIRYLRLALDIPYCHHEKWDGSGYPRKLIGNQIPLVARIFTVVDVWDALRSDRPYRLAWKEEKVRQYIRSTVGTHFDPQVVDAFLQLLD